MQAKIMSLEAQLNKANQQIKELEGKSTADSKAEVKPEGTEASGEFFFQKSSGSSDFMMKISEQSVMSVPSIQINLFQNGAAKASPGGLWAFDMREGGGRDPVRFENFSADM